MKILLATLLFHLIFLFSQDSGVLPYSAIVLKNANLREGPGITFKIVGFVKTNEEINIVNENGDKTWLQLDNKKWIASFLVKRVENLTPTLTVTSVATATPQPAVTSTPLSYICNRDFYNCSDFHDQSSAQNVYDYCLAIIKFDIHKLDRDNDNYACESN